MTEGFLLPWTGPLVHGRLVRRYHRFLADVALDDGRTVTAHCVNSGSMEGLVVPGARVWLVPAPGAHRKLAFTWCAMELDGVALGVDTVLPNRLVRAMLEARALPFFRGYDEVLPEFVHAPGSRVDFRLESKRGVHDVEVKNCHLVYPDGRGYFPDSVSERATKHLDLLAAEASPRHRATVLFVVQHPSVRSVRPSELHDPAFAAAARRAAEAGVRFRALRTAATPEGVRVLGSVPVDLAPYALDEMRAWRAERRGTSGWERPPKVR